METTKRLKRERYLFWLLLGGLLFLRFPWIILGRVFAPAYSIQITVIFEVGTCLLTFLLIFLERKRLAEYHVDRLALVLLACAPIAVLVGRMAAATPCPGRRSRLSLPLCF